MARLILVVEDEARLAALVKAFLVDRGFSVVVARDGKEGLELARRHRPALVLSDVLLPHLTGWDLCRAVKSDQTLQATKVILMTAVYTKARYRLDATEAGADGFVSKPLDLEDLAARIHQLLPEESVSAGPPAPVSPPPRPAAPATPVEPPPPPRPAAPPVPAEPPPPRTGSTGGTQAVPGRVIKAVDVSAALAGLAELERRPAKPHAGGETKAPGFDKRLAAMRRSFAAALPETLARIERAWAAAAGAADPRLWEELARLGHDLAGSAGSFGLPAVGDAARELEEAVRDLLASGGPVTARTRLAVKQQVERLGALVHLL